MSTYLNGAKISYSDSDIYGNIKIIYAILQKYSSKEYYNKISLDGWEMGVRMFPEILEMIVEKVKESTENEWNEMLSSVTDSPEWFDKDEYCQFLFDLVKNAKDSKDNFVYIFSS